MSVRVPYTRPSITDLEVGYATGLRTKLKQKRY